eukprot:1799808-Pyramimonas_sp.AAC.1
MVHTRSARAREARLLRAVRLKYVRPRPFQRRYVEVSEPLVHNARAMVHGLHLHAELQRRN